jgi:hypothetical protein
MILDNEGKRISIFGLPFEYENHNKTLKSNIIQFTTNKENIFVSFQHANKIQKYSLSGKLEM